MLRAAFLLVSALTTGVTLGRKAIDSAVKRKKESIIEQAAAEARQRLRGHADEYLKLSLTQFIQAVFIKAMLLISAWLFYRFGLYPFPVFSGILVTLLAVFIIRDAVIFFPTARLILSKLHNHGWRPKKAVGEAVAARVFEQVLEEAGDFKPGRTIHIVLSLAGHKMDDLTRDIAIKVSDIARETSWHDLRPFLFAAGGKFITLSALYSGFVFVLLHSA